MKAYFIGLRLLKREWRAGELKVLAAALLIAVTSVTAVAFFTDRIAQALNFQAAELLAADMRVAADHPIRQALYDEAAGNGLSRVTVLSFRSMALAAGASQLTEIKAVSEGYPLRGALRISNKPFDVGVKAHSIPQPGEVWVETQLMTTLGLELGESIQLGEKTFTLAQLLIYEPDRGGDLFSIAPRVLMNMVDLEATGLIQEGSRIQYRLLVSGEQAAIKKFRRSVENSLQRGERVEDLSDARQEVRVALDRANQFLGLAAIIAVILSCIAIAMSARRFAERHLSACAVMRCVGARQNQILSIFVTQLIVIGIVCSALGAALGYLAQWVLAWILGGLVVAQLPQPSLWPAVTGLSVGLISLLGFAMPPIVQLRDVPALKVLRREVNAIKPLTLTSYVLGIMALAGLVIWQAGGFKLGAIVLGGIAGVAIVLALTAVLLMQGLRKLPARGTIAWRFGVSNLVRRRRAGVIQVVAFGIGIMVLLLLTVVRGDLMQTWQSSLPADASNRFVINIQPAQLTEVREFFKSESHIAAQFFPMVRARLTHVNAVSVDPDAQSDERSRRLMHREFNLSWAQRLQEDNNIVAGDWWQADGHIGPQFSLEEGIAEHLDIKLGDTMSFNIGGADVSAPVTSLRTVQWDTFRANFFVIAPPDMLQDFPASYITSFYLSDAHSTLLDKLVKRFPNLTVIDISAIMSQVRAIMQKVALAVEYVFAFTLLAGLTVLFASIQATHDERLFENAVMRAVGAAKSRLLKALAAEFVLLGVLAGILAAIFAWLLGFVVAEFIFELRYQFNPMIGLAGIVGGGVGIGLAGIAGTRSVLVKPPLQVLRNH